MRADAPRYDHLAVGFDPVAAFTCKLCRGRQVEASYRLKPHQRDSQTFIAATCTSCGLFQTVYDWQEATRIQRSLMSALTYDFDPLWESERELAANQAKGRSFATALDEAGLVRGKRILDIGCGHGHFLHECLSLGAASVTGQEFFRGTAIAYAKGELLIDDIRTAPFDDLDTWPDTEFDVVCSFDVLEHLHDLASFFSECIRVASPRGVLFHATPGLDSPTTRIGRLAISRVGRSSRVRKVGTVLCNLQPAHDFTGGAHVSLLGRRPIAWLVSHYPLTLVKAHYKSSFTYSNQHYATLVPPLSTLPLPIGSAIFAIVRQLVRNKLVFVTRKTGDGG